MSRKSKALDSDNVKKIKQMAGPMGQPIPLISKSLELSEYQVKKAIKTENLEKCQKSYISVIINRAFKEDLSDSEFVKQRALAKKLFGHAPDIRFWSQFSFSEHGGKYTCLTYFLTGFLDKLRVQYESFNYIAEQGLTPGAEMVARQLFPDKDLTQSNFCHILIQAAQIFDKFPDEDFWQNFSLLKEFPEYDIGSLNFFLMDFALKRIESNYKMFKMVIPKTQRTEVPENKVGEDYNSVSNKRSLIEFLKS